MCISYVTMVVMESMLFIEGDYNNEENNVRNDAGGATIYCSS
jgi:hypothetical protein